MSDKDNKDNNNKPQENSLKSSGSSSWKRAYERTCNGGIGLYYKNNKFY